MGGIIVTYSGFFRRRTALHNAYVEEMNFTFMDLGSRFNIKNRPPADATVHPVIGPIGQFGTLEGNFGPCRIRFSICVEMSQTDDELAVCFPEIQATERRDKRWSREPLEVNDNTIDSLYTSDAVQRAVEHFPVDHQRQQAYHALMRLISESTSVELDGRTLTVQRNSTTEYPAKGLMYACHIDPVEELTEWLNCVKAVTDVWVPVSSNLK